MKTGTISLFAPLLLVLFSCSSGLTRPPQQEFLTKIAKEIKADSSYIKDLEINRLEENERQGLIYLQALNFQNEGNKKAACDRYKYLSKDKTFPLAELSLIKSLDVCEYLKVSQILLWKNSLQNVSPYLEKVFLQKSLKLSRKKDMEEFFTRFAVRYTDHLETQEEKEKHLKSSIKYLQKRSLPELVKIVGDKLTEVSPRFINEPTQEQYLAVAKDWARTRKFKKARYYFKKVFNSENHNPLDRIEAYRRYAMTYKLQRNKKAYSWRLEQLLAWFKKQTPWLENPALVEKYRELHILSARAQWTVNYRTRAENHLKGLIHDKAMDSATIAHAYLLLGKISLEKKKHDLSEKYYLLGLGQPGISDDVLEDLSWSLGWSYYLKNKYDLALKVFKETLDRTNDISFKRKLTFWTAKIFSSTGAKDEAVDLLEGLMAEDPYGYYGIAAAMELSRPLPQPEKRFYQTEDSPYAALDWIVAFNNWELAEEFIKSLEKEKVKKSEIEDLLPLYHYARWYEGGIFKFFSLSKEDREDIEKDHLPAAFPTPYLSEARSAAEKSGLSTSFIYSIARQESAFNPKIRSWADAFGLLQLTPEKAKSLARKNKIPYKNYTDLYDVEKNLKLGSLLLGNLVENTRGDFISVVASYNAGRRPVRGWYKSRFREDPFEFIEMIPYHETKTYIKLVLRNLATYERLLGKPWNRDKAFLYQKLN